MTESFLHYVWLFQYFEKKDLATTRGEPLQIFDPGILNRDAGPDFLQARIRIGEMDWMGSVEIHINASGWRDHRHDKDLAYDNVILHVVWKANCAVTRPDGSEPPAVELKNRIDQQLILKYNKLLTSPDNLPCASHLGSVRGLIKRDMLDKTLLQRLERKAGGVLEVYRRSGNDWEETLYQLICSNFGFKVNSEPLQQLAKALPFKVLLKHADRLIKLEALFFGQAGLLGVAGDDRYCTGLKREHALLAKKYDLEERIMRPAQWRFLRLRPANFPTLRLAQLAALFYRHPRIFSKVMETENIRDLRSIFAVRQSEYWLHHYRFGQAQERTIPSIGTTSIDNIVVNTVVPLLVAYGKTSDDQQWLERALTLLEGIPAEENSITRKWKAMNEPVVTAFDSQACIELYNDYCRMNRCLNCTIGTSLVKPSKV